MFKKRAPKGRRRGRKPLDDEAVLDAAAAVLRAGDPLSVASVAAKLGVARGTVYLRFPDREALLGALVATGRIAQPPAPEADVRERILDAVGRALRRHGFTATTIEEVAAEAGVGVATVYRRFGDRKGLLGAFVAERTPRSLAGQLDTRHGDPEAGLLQLARATVAFLREHRWLLPIVLGADPKAAALLSDIRGSSESLRQVTARFLNRHFPDPTGRTALAFLVLLTGVAAGGTGDVEDDARFVVSTFLRGVGR